MNWRALIGSYDFLFLHSFLSGELLSIVGFTFFGLLFIFADFIGCTAFGPRAGWRSSVAFGIGAVDCFLIAAASVFVFVFGFGFSDNFVILVTVVFVFVFAADWAVVIEAVAVAVAFIVAVSNFLVKLSDVLV